MLTLSLFLLEKEKASFGLNAQGVLPSFAFFIVFLLLAQGTDPGPPSH